MNWINAKDRLPENGQQCFVWIDKDCLPEFATFKKDSQDNDYFVVYVEWRGDDTYPVTAHTIFWIPVEEIPKPEMK